MITQRPSGLLTATAIPDGMRVRPKRVEITLRRKGSPGLPRRLVIDNLELPQYRIECERQGWEIIRERLVG